MKSSAKKIELASVDDLFSTEEGRQDAKLEKIQEIPLSELHPFKNHPFKVKDDEAMMETADSIKQYGVLVPAIARPDPEGGYELVAGHRRHRASELAEKETMPVIVRDLDDDAATIIMVDSNLQRESLLPSERAFAYKMKLDAIKHQGARTDLTSAQVGPKLTAAEKIAENSPDSKSQIKRFIRLTELIPELMDMVDEKKIALNPAYELSFLKKEEQIDLLDAMDSEQATPSLSQAQRLKVIYESYRIKVLNTINFKKSMHYNPFAYIHSEKDILKLVTTLIANTKGEGKAGDDFWVKAETLLYCALIGYIHYEAPLEEQNFSTLIEFINAMEVREDDEEFKNPVDLMFDALESEKPNHFAVRQYKKYKLAAGDICSK